MIFIIIMYMYNKIMYKCRDSKTANHSKQYSVQKNMKIPQYRFISFTCIHCKKYNTSTRAKKSCVVLQKVFEVKTPMNVRRGFPVPCLDLIESYNIQILLTKLYESSESFLEGHLDNVGSSFS